MWVMAALEVSGRSHHSFYWRFERNVNLEELSLSRFKWLVPRCYELTNRSKEQLNNRAMYHPARASSDVASSLAPSPCRRTDASARSRSRVVVSSARLCVLLLSLPAFHPASSPSEGPAAPAEVAAVPMLQQLPAARSHP